MTQSDAVLAHLRSGKTLTPRDAYLLYGCLALHSRAAELRAAGHDIHCRIVVNGRQRYGEYKLISAPQGAG